MTIYCKICSHKIQSEKPEADAQKHVLEQMSKHLSRHPEQASTLAQSILTTSQLLATYMLIQRCVRIPPEEKALQESFDQNEQSLLEIFGLELEPKD